MVDSSGLAQQLNFIIKDLGFPSVILSVLGVSCLMATRQGLYSSKHHIIIPQPPRRKTGGKEKIGLLLLYLLLDCWWLSFPTPGPSINLNLTRLL